MGQLECQLDKICMLKKGNQSIEPQYMMKSCKMHMNNSIQQEERKIKFSFCLIVLNLIYQIPIIQTKTLGKQIIGEINAKFAENNVLNISLCLKRKPSSFKGVGSPAQRLNKLLSKVSSVNNSSH